MQAVLWRSPNEAVSSVFRVLLHTLFTSCSTFRNRRLTLSCSLTTSCRCPADVHFTWYNTASSLFLHLWLSLPLGPVSAGSPSSSSSYSVLLLLAPAAAVTSSVTLSAREEVKCLDHVAGTVSRALPKSYVVAHSNFSVHFSTFGKCDLWYGDLVCAQSLTKLHAPEMSYQ